MKKNRGSKKPSPPTAPMSFSQLVELALKDKAFATRIHRLAKRAVTSDAALAELGHAFTLSTRDLKRLGIPASEAMKFPTRCTIPTMVTLVGFLPFLGRPRK